MRREDASNFKFLTTQWENGWRMKNGQQNMKVRFLARECQCAEHREDLFSHERHIQLAESPSSFCWSWGWKRSEQTQWTRTTRRESARTQSWNSLQRTWRNLRRQAKARTLWRLGRQQRWVEHLAPTMVEKLVFKRCDATPQFCRHRRCTWKTTMELHPRVRQNN